MLSTEVVRHICGGHEYRYNTKTGDIRNNYGSVIATVRFEKLIPSNVRSIATISTVNADGSPEFLGIFASIRNETDPSTLAKWAIRECATRWPDGIPGKV